MNKINVLLFAIAIMSPITAFSRQAGDKQAAFQMSFIPPLGTQGMASPDYTNTVSLNLLAGISRNETAFAMGGLANIVRNDASGFQIAGLCNYAGNTGRGMMLSGLANVVGHAYKGFQLAGLANISGEMTGLQLSGLVNIAKDVKGFQMGGLVNIARRVSGVQFAGLVNIAESSDCPIGLLNIIKEGEYGLGVTYNEIGNILATFRSGGRYTYGILGIGYNHSAKGEGVAVEAGFGAHIYLTKWFRLNNELKCGTIDFSQKSTYYANYALLPAFRIGKRIELFGGPSINYMQSNSAKNRNLFPGGALWNKFTDSKLQQVHIGYQVGLQVIL